jgi:Tfp pilus assembly protein PilO
MMGARNTARIWVFAGAAAIVLLALAFWFMLISPKFAEAADVRIQVDDNRTQLIGLRKRIAGLEAQLARLPEYKADLRRNHEALPPDSGVPDFLRQLQDSGEATGVRVSDVSVAPPAQADGLPGAWQLPINLTAEGDPDHLGDFLDQLQAVQPRAVLVQTASLTSGGIAAADSGKPSLSLTLMAFVAPSSGTAPTVVTN